MVTTVSILIVDDNQVEQDIMCRKLKQHGITSAVYHAQNGMEALTLLRGTEDMEQIPKPRVILLDWHMPVMSGKEFLREIADDSELKDEVVFVVTAMPSEADREYAIQSNVADYISKEDVGEFFETHKQIFTRIGQ